jgi:glycerol-3-phosphate dehydrogenase (NAD(P)+)
MSAITLFGAGSWGTALSAHLASTGRDVTLWVRRAEVAEAIHRTGHNPRYLPSLPIPSSIHVTADLDEAAAGAQLWGLAVPSQKLRARAESLRSAAGPDVRVVSLAKGIENDTLMTMTQVLDDVFDAVPSSRIGTLSGPSHAEEVAEGRPTSLVAAAPTADAARALQKAVITERLRVYANTDVLGVEIGGAAKNVLAIAAGISDGVGYGDNAKAALVTRGLAEIRRLGQAMGARPETFSGLSGIGDLVATCTSEHSRNRRLGELVGEGRDLGEVLDAMEMVAEGVRTTQSLVALAERHDVEMPIAAAVHAVLFDGKRPGEMVKRLMTRTAKSELGLPDSVEPIDPARPSPAST